MASEAQLSKSRGASRIRSPLNSFRTWNSCQTTYDYRSDHNNSATPSVPTSTPEYASIEKVATPVISPEIHNWNSQWTSIVRYSKYSLPLPSELSVYSGESYLGPPEMSYTKKVMHTITPVSGSWVWREHPKEADESKKWSRSYEDNMKSPYLPLSSTCTSSKKQRNHDHSVAKCRAWLDAHQYWM